MAESKVVLITGCSSGFGLLTAARLAAHGHKVYATMRNLDKKEFLEVEAANRGGDVNLTILMLDVTKPDTIKQAVSQVVAQEGVIDVLINNAGFAMGGFFEDLSEADWKAQFDVNFFGVLNVTRAVLPVMRPRRKGLIINISSISGFSGLPALSAYSSSKFALEGFSESLYTELHSFGIDVALVEPGLYRTKIIDENARYAAKFFDQQSPYYSKSQLLKKHVSDISRVRNGNPEDVAVVIEKLINSSSPSFRNIIGFKSKLRFWLVRVIPFKLFAWIIAFVFPSDAEK